MSEVASASGTQDFYAPHDPAVIHFFGDGRTFGGLEKTRPSGAGFELVFRVEEGLSAAGASVDALFMVVPVLAREGALRAFFAQDEARHVGQFLPPFIFRLRDGQPCVHGCRLVRRFCLCGAGGHAESEDKAGEEEGIVLHVRWILDVQPLTEERRRS